MVRDTCTDTPSEGVSIGLLPSRHDADDRMGHVWLFWLGTEGPLQSIRGFWPDPDDIPEDAGPLREFFYVHSVGGLIRVDYRAAEFMRRYQSQFRHMTWTISDSERLLLDFLCFVPPRRDSTPFGRYSCNEDRADWHNCSSWAKSVLDALAGINAFFSCDRPKRLRYVQHEIWGTQW